MFASTHVHVEVDINVNITVANVYHLLRKWPPYLPIPAKHWSNHLYETFSPFPELTVKKRQFGKHA